MSEISPQYRQQLQELAERLVYPERFAGRAVVRRTVGEIPVENLGGLFDEPNVERGQE